MAQVFTKARLEKKRDEIQGLIDAIQQQFDSPTMSMEEGEGERGELMTNVQFKLTEAVEMIEEVINE